MTEIRRLRLDRSDADHWMWTDEVTGERGRLRRDRPDLEPGAVVVVEVERTHTGWRAVRWLEPPMDRRAGSTDASVLVDGVPAGLEPPVPPPVDLLAPGTIRTLIHVMDARSTGARDEGHETKLRPALIVAHRAGSDQVEVSFLYGTNSAVHRSGSGRRIRDWRAAGLRKPSVVSAAVELRSVAELGPSIGRLSAHDHDRILGR